MAAGGGASTSTTAVAQPVPKPQEVIDLSNDLASDSDKTAAGAASQLEEFTRADSPDLAELFSDDPWSTRKIDFGYKK
ncbi:hypothetical protein WOLCODRAFT_29783 [Wolfiporia cocos MD-104 SS10]|uniref:Uncharacterized protein n=1 Tax=Wolfiporia cocos (strain MD-104) TaxID=742152 RepID=A0A2H3IYD5_WOLCO|nr:hypothetical protein WOLCODRAFT_27570 [Wolfiporia cocos MD-104 SS10]PCH40632.1 hypothetical protein WOLCODRAFT_29783 [Wolfiporia cocos MD-104 SS10]